ncbi:hypothetical protein BGZ65_004638 [Modicella reniformis]|uniref:FAD-binding domain-containing protein n=1 Tax=Modicella reniformis TaxID=1440133 RepID=A0A9P6IND5_9FUNG|nr:hypothetical protein BGZ65_004638 [Modicella reniformis]
MSCHKANPSNVKVLIIGAGIGGLTMAALLEKAGINYLVFERAKEVKPLGSALSLGSNVMPIFQQLGILDEVLKSSKPFGFSTGYNEQREATRTLDYSPAEKIGGYLPHIISRSIFYDILVKLVPSEKILMSKKILSLLQNKEGVLIRCSDNKTYHGDILIGADGAYSAVRQSLYKELTRKGDLPRSDALPLPSNTTCLVGQTRPLDPEEFTHLKDWHSWFESTLGENKPYAWVTFSTKANTICWMILRHLDDKASRELDSSFRNSEWGPEAAEAMCKEVRDFPVARNNMTVGDLIDATPRELISKVMLEEKIFETWHAGRTCLLGDGKLPDNPSMEEIHKAFQLYKSERYPHAKAAFDTSHRMAGLVGQHWYNDVLRTVIKYLPKGFFTRSLQVMYHYRPQVSFLEPAKDLGQLKPAPQPSLFRARARKEEEFNKNHPRLVDTDASSLRADSISTTTTTKVGGSSVYGKTF